VRGTLTTTARRPALRRRASRGWLACALCAALGLAAALVGGWRLDPRANASEPTGADRERFARHRLEDAHAFRRQGRLEPAERALRRGLAVEPAAPDLHRALARVLEEMGRTEEAKTHWGRADALAPPPPPPPATPVSEPSSQLLVVLLAPGPGDEHPVRLARDWPDGDIADVLEQRLRVRLPDATVVHATAESVAASRTWIAEFAPRAAISLRADRAYCGDTLKDGPFALAWLRVAAAAAGSPLGEPRLVREVVSYPRPWSRCESLAVARALEQALALPELRTALQAPRASEGMWSTAALRALFPELGRRLAAELEVGRRRMALGDLAGAEAAFRRAARIDPDDPQVRAYLAEMDATLAITRDLDTTADESPLPLDPRLSRAERSALEAQLAEEQRRREDLLATLAVLEAEVESPPANVLAALRPVEVGDPQAFGPALARARADGAVESRAAYAPDGTPLARYYFAAGSERPVLREEDTSGDGQPDRWIVYEGRARSEVWEDADGAGRPRVRMIFGPGGLAVVRIEFLTGDGKGLERVFHYANDALVSQDHDTNGDGSLDRFDRFDAKGRLHERGEDLDGDGRVDLRSIYREGKLVRREIASPDFLPNDT
jgi:tetratricopeptide (TPR) repeat protein